jgi:hypothetical protein
MLVKYVCPRSFITIRSHDLHVGNIRGAMGDITSYHTRGSSFLPSLVPTGYMSFGFSLAFPFVFCVMVQAIDFYLIFCHLVIENSRNIH